MGECKPRQIDVHTWDEMNRPDSAVDGVLVRDHKDDPLVKLFTYMLKGNVSGLSIHKIGSVKWPSGYDAVQLYMCGGLNGRGRWEDYFGDLSRLVATIREKCAPCKEVALTDMHVDYADDVFYFVLNIVNAYDKPDSGIDKGISPDDFYEKYIRNNIILAGLPWQYHVMLNRYRADVLAMALECTADNSWNQAVAGVRGFLAMHGLDGESW